MHCVRCLLTTQQLLPTLSSCLTAQRRVASPALAHRCARARTFLTQAITSRRLARLAFALRSRNLKGFLLGNLRYRRPKMPTSSANQAKNAPRGPHRTYTEPTCKLHGTYIDPARTLHGSYIDHHLTGCVRCRQVWVATHKVASLTV